MIWQGIELRTYGEIGAAAAALTTREEGQEFMRLYRAQSEHADANIGYLSGYYDRETMRRIQGLCGVVHPIFGRSEPSTNQLLAAGRAVMLGADPNDVRTLLDDHS